MNTCKPVRKFLLINRYSTDLYGRLFRQYDDGYSEQIGYTEHIDHKRFEKYFRKDTDEGFVKIDIYRETSYRNCLLGRLRLHPDIDPDHWLWVNYDVYVNENDVDDIMYFVMLHCDQGDYIHNPTFVYDGWKTLLELSKMAVSRIVGMETAK